MGKVWEVIHDNKDLNLPAHRVMVANIRCAEIAQEQISAFAAAEAWQSLEAAASQDLIPGFGKTAAGLLDGALAAYQEEARYFDAGVSSARLDLLATELLGMMRPAYDAQLSLARDVALESFRLGMAAPESAGATFVDRAGRCTASALSEFDVAAQDLVVEGTDWTAGAAREELQRQIAAHQAELRAEHVALALHEAAEAAEAGVSAGAMPLLEAPQADLWARLDAVLAREVKTAAAKLTAALHGYGVDPTEEAEVRGKMKAAARGRLLANAREAANTALPRMKDRFAEVFQKDEQGMPRSWTPSVDIAAVANEAKRESARLLSMLCVVRLGATAGATGPDEVERAILRLAEGSSVAAAKAPAAADQFDIVSAAEWPSVAKEDVLLPPSQARTVWRQFSSDTALSIQQAKATQEANRLAQNRLPPLWAMAAMVILGFNEFVAVLRNPLWLVLLIIVFAFARTVYQELDVEGEMQRGLLPGAMALSAKFVPTLKTVTQRTIESGKALLEGPPAGADRDGGPVTPAHGGVADPGNGSLRVRYDMSPAGAAGEGIRARRPQEVEMASQDFGANGVGAKSRKDD